MIDVSRQATLFVERSLSCSSLFRAAIWRRGRLDLNRQLLSIAIALSVVMVAAIDFATSSALIGSILFTLPLALCALQPSGRVLAATAVVAGVSTIAAGFGGFDRAIPGKLFKVFVFLFFAQRSLMISKKILGERPLPMVASHAGDRPNDKIVIVPQ